MPREYRTVRLEARIHDKLREFAKEEGRSMQEVLASAIDEYRAQRFFDRLNADYAALRADPEAWKEYQDEMKLWDATLMDGLDPDEDWDPATGLPRKLKRRKPARKGARAAR